MDVAMITFHNALNYGAALQVYAAQKAIEDLGVNCDVLNYLNDHRANAYDMKHHINQHLENNNYAAALKYFLGSFFMKKREKEFGEFYSQYLNTTDEVYKSSSDLEKINDEYDKFIVGSDQVWNYGHNGNDYSFFLNFVKDDNKKISYSSSFGLSEIPEELKDNYKKYLNEIKHLSTREEYGVKLIKELTSREAELVLDPVFLLDKSHWKTFYQDSKLKNQDYVFSYTNKKGQFKDFVSKTNYPLKNKKVHKLTKHLSPKDFIDPNVKVAYSISLNKFIESVANANLVVSASFHCVAMAIVLQVPFVAILTDNEGRNERIRNILKLTGLENRILTDKMTLEDVNKIIDYNSVENKLNKQKEKSLNFLKESLFD